MTFLHRSAAEEGYQLLFLHVTQSSPHRTVAIRALAFVVVDIFDKIFYFGVLILLSDSFKVVVISLTIEIKSFK